MKRIVCSFLLMMIVFSMLSAGVSAEGEKNSVSETKISKISVFGDSIPAGYGLEDYNYKDLSASEQCFVNLFAKHYGLDIKKDVTNLSDTGLESAEINKKMKEVDKSVLENSDVVIISAGANDIMDTFANRLFYCISLNEDFADKYHLEVDSTSLYSIEASIIRILFDPTKEEALEALARECTDEDSMKMYKLISASVEYELQSMINRVKENNPDAQIYLITPYDPVLGLSLKSNQLTKVLDDCINDLCDTINELADSQEYGENVHSIDLRSEFDGKYQELTNISSLDIHPNKDGHALIAERLISMEEEALNPQVTADKTDEKSQEGSKNTDSSSDKKDSSASEPEKLEAPFSDTVVYILMGVAIAAALAIIGHGIIKFKKK